MPPLSGDPTGTLLSTSPPGTHFRCTEEHLEEHAYASHKSPFKFVFYCLGHKASTLMNRYSKPPMKARKTSGPCNFAWWELVTSTASADHEIGSRLYPCSPEFLFGRASPEHCEYQKRLLPKLVIHSAAGELCHILEIG